MRSLQQQLDRCVIRYGVAARVVQCCLLHVGCPLRWEPRGSRHFCLARLSVFGGKTRSSSKPTCRAMRGTGFWEHTRMRLTRCAHSLWWPTTQSMAESEKASRLRTHQRGGCRVLARRPAPALCTNRRGRGCLGFLARRHRCCRLDDDGGRRPPRPEVRNVPTRQWQLSGGSQIPRWRT